MTTPTTTTPVSAVSSASSAGPASSTPDSSNFGYGVLQAWESLVKRRGTGTSTSCDSSNNRDMAITLENVVGFLKDVVKVGFGKFVLGDSGTNIGGELPLPQGTYDSDAVVT